MSIENRKIRKTGMLGKHSFSFKIEKHFQKVNKGTNIFIETHSNKTKTIVDQKYHSKM